MGISLQPTERRLRVAVGMSGGVDSSVAAALLVEQGHEVVGLTAYMWKEGSRCCSLDDVRRAAAVASKLGIPHYVVEAFAFFGERVVSPFVSEYARGRTPSPCIRCNESVKFGLLLREALALGCSHFATGHYARIERRADGWHLLRARDLGKDQSYFLHRLDEGQLSHALFPLGEFTKDEVVQFARERRLPVPERQSQDLCFVPSGGHAAFVEKRRPLVSRPGPIVDTTGRVLGTHHGIHHFTIGQREGLRIPARTRLYVKELRADTNTVVVAPRDELYARGCRLVDVHWIRAMPENPLRCRVQIRYRHDAAPAVVRAELDSGVVVTFDQPQFAVTPGQAAVFYAGDEVLGGGWIAEALWKEP